VGEITSKKSCHENIVIAVVKGEERERLKRCLATYKITDLKT
jgi:predicted transcriptional regulator